jgi:hypothetical protein
MNVKSAGWLYFMRHCFMRHCFMVRKVYICVVGFYRKLSPLDLA